jgi:hypothetical protein
MVQFFETINKRKMSRFHSLSSQISREGNENAADHTRCSRNAFNRGIAPWFSSEHASWLEEDLRGIFWSFACAFLYTRPLILTGA